MEFVNKDLAPGDPGHSSLHNGHTQHLGGESRMMHPEIFAGLCCGQKETNLCYYDGIRVLQRKFCRCSNLV